MNELTEIRREYKDLCNAIILHFISYNADRLSVPEEIYAIYHSAEDDVNRRIADAASKAK